MKHSPWTITKSANLPASPIITQIVKKKKIEKMLHENGKLKICLCNLCGVIKKCVPLLAIKEKVFSGMRKRKQC